MRNLDHPGLDLLRDLFSAAVDELLELRLKARDASLAQRVWDPLR